VTSAFSTPSDPVQADPTGSDPFGTAALRAAVLVAWAASPARFREDANAEESLTLGYADRVVAELAANAADAAHAAGRPGELWIRLIDGELRAANTGAPLTADGVAALASLRASAKRATTPAASDPHDPSAPDDRDEPGSVGHFGVGFTAVRALTDDPIVVSAAGGIRFSAADTLAAVTALDVPALQAEVAARGGLLPALRLPWPVSAATPPPPAGFDTEVRLPLRTGVDVAALDETLTAQACLDLLWALPDLRSVRLGEHQAVRAAVTADTSEPADSSEPADPVEPPETAEPLTVEVDGVARRFRTVMASGSIPDELLLDRPVEERGRTAWRLTWVLPLRPDGRPNPLSRSVIGAPTPTDEPLTLPAVLVGTFPVDDTRRHLARGPLVDHLIARAVEAYADLVLACPAADRPALIPAAGFPAGPLDARLRDGVLGALHDLRFLVGAGGGPLRPTEARVLPGLTDPGARLFADVVPGLIGWPSSGSVAGTAARLRSVGVSTVAVGAVSAALAGVERPVEFWLGAYDALTSVLAESGADLDELADLPVPRAGGGTVVGPRGVLVPDRVGGPAGRPHPGPADAPESVLGRAAAQIPGLRIAAAGASHPLLHRLGAVSADAAAILADPLTASEIRRRREDLDEFDPDPEDVVAFGDLIADLVGAAGGGPVAGETAATDRTPLPSVLLTDVDGEAWPAGDLLLPGAPLAEVLVDDADLPTVAARWIDRHPTAVLEALGVHGGFGVATIPLPPDPDSEINGLADWWDQVGSHAGPLDAVLVIRDLDLVADHSWPAALTMIMSDRRTRDALRPLGSAASYSAWWIGRHARFGGEPAWAWRVSGAHELDGLFDPLPVELPAGAAAEIGALADLEAAVARAPHLLVRRWADSARHPVPAGVPALTAAVVGILAGDPELDLPETVRTIDGGVVDADRAVVVDQPWLAQAIPPSLVVAAGGDPARTSAALDIDRASEVVRTEVVPEPPGPGPALPGTDAGGVLGDIEVARRCLDFFGLADLATTPVVARPDLSVEVVLRGDRRPRVRVGWWAQDGRLYCDAEPAGAGRLVAYLAGRWADRHAFATVAADGFL
jgi:hypothetical protein